MRTRTMHFPSQELMAKDNMTIHVEAVASYKVNDLLKALCDIEDGDGAISQAAQVRAISGHHDSTAGQDAGRTRVQTSDWTDLRNHNNRSQSATSSPAPHSTKSYTTATKPDGTSSRGRSVCTLTSSLGHNHRSRQDQNHPIGHIDDPSLWAEWPRPSGSCRQTYAQNTAEKHTVLSPSNLEASVAEALVRLQSKCTDAAGGRRWQDRRGLKYKGGKDDRSDDAGS